MPGRKLQKHVVVALTTLALAICIAADRPSRADEIVRTSSPAERGLDEADFPRVQKIAANVYTYEALTGSEDDRYTTNSLFVVSEQGVLVADGQGSVNETMKLIAAIAQITNVPITHVVIASDHRDHTAGNAAFPADVEFIAHMNSATTLGKAATNPARDTAEPAIPMPTIVIKDGLTLDLGKTAISVIFFGRAHTGGDLMVYLPAEKILFASEVFLNHMFSGFRSAYTEEWIEVVKKAEQLDVDVYIPGHGFVDSPAILAEEWTAHKNHLQTVFDEITRLHAAGRSVEEAIDDANFGIYENWSGASFQGPIAIRRIYAELNNEL